jgi:hypothetical protein
MKHTRLDRFPLELRPKISREIGNKRSPDKIAQQTASSGERRKISLDLLAVGPSKSASALRLSWKTMTNAAQPK